MEIGLQNKIKELLMQRELTQEELATKIKVTRKTINTIENGVFIPSVILAIRLARFFKVRVEDLFLLKEKKSHTYFYSSTPACLPQSNSNS
jgi:putative transcriptional regulator